MDGDEHMMI